MQLKLDENQKRAVFYDRGNLLVIAGPGAGKTRVIIGRMEHLIENGVAPDRILAVTFTNKAADEIMDRVIASLPDTATKPTVSTFHSFAHRILREFHDTAGLDEHFTVIDENAQDAILIEILRAHSIAPSINTLRRLKTHLDYEKSRASYPFGHPSIKEEIADEIRDVYRDYHRFLINNKAVDFNDLIILAMMILSGDEKARQKLRNRYDHILLDEFQDINRAQYDLVSLMVRDDAKVLAVADADQMIYNWRGSDPQLTTDFLKDYSAERIELTANYRSSDTIILACKHLIAHNKPPQMRRVPPPSKAKPSVAMLEVESNSEEAEAVKRIIERNVQEGFKLGEMAIIYRMHGFGDEIEQELAARDIPLLRVRPNDEFLREGLDQILSYLRLTQNLFDWDVKSAWDFPRRIMNPLEGYRITSTAHRLGMSLFKLASETGRLNELSPLARKRIERFIKLVHELSLLGDDISPSGYFRELRKRLNMFLSPFNSEESKKLTLALMEHAADSSTLVKRLSSDSSKPLVLLIHEGGTMLQLVSLIIGRALKDYLKIPTQIVSGATVSEATWKNLEKRVSSDNPLVIIMLGDVSYKDTFLQEFWSRGFAFDLFTIASPFKDEKFWTVLAAYRFIIDLLSNMPSAVDERLVFYDLETTGVDPRRCEIIELSALTTKMHDEEHQVYTTLVKPESMPSAEIQSLTGITPKMLKDGIEPSRALSEFDAIAQGSVLIGHNIESFDNIILERYYPPALKKDFIPDFIDTVTWARELFPGENNKLEAIGKRFHLKTEGVHRAGEDVRLNRDVFIKLLEYDGLLRGLDFSREAIIMMALAALEREKPEEGVGGAFISAAIRILAREEVDLKSLENDLSKAFSESTTSELRERIELLSKEPYPEDVQREKWESLADYLMAMIIKYEERDGENGLSGFINHCALLREADLLGEGNAVKMMTIHAAKGLEFPIVIIIGLEQGSIPHYLALEKLDRIEEERRLLYVAMSRARKKIYLVYTQKRDGRFRPQSMFLQEIPQSLMKRFRQRKKASHKD